MAESIQRAIDNLFGRADWPMAVRLAIQPIMAAAFALRDGLRDTRLDRPPYGFSLFLDPEYRGHRRREDWKSIRTVFACASCGCRLLLPPPSLEHMCFAYQVAGAAPRSATRVQVEIDAMERLGLDELRLQWRNRWGRLPPAHIPRALLFRRVGCRTPRAPRSRAFASAAMESNDEPDRKAGAPTPSMSCVRFDSHEDASHAIAAGRDDFQRRPLVAL